MADFRNFRCRPMSTPLPRLVALAAVASALVLAGCASRPAPGSGSAAPAPAAATAPAPAPAAAERLAPGVAVPPASARKVVLVMSGPKTVVEAKDWADFKREWQATFADHAKASNVAFSFADTAPAPGAEDGTLLAVEVNDYRMVGIAARIMFGIMTGNAYIDAKVRYSSLRDGKPFGEAQYNTSSSAAGGVFSKVTPQQVDQIATNVFLDFKSAK